MTVLPDVFTVLSLMPARFCTSGFAAALPALGFPYRHMKGKAFHVCMWKGRDVGAVSAFWHSMYAYGRGRRFALYFKGFPCMHVEGQRHGLSLPFGIQCMHMEG